VKANSQADPHAIRPFWAGWKNQKPGEETREEPNAESGDRGSILASFLEKFTYHAAKACFRGLPFPVEMMHPDSSKMPNKYVFLLKYATLHLFHQRPMLIY
jgi:hypothetical protein